MPAVPAVPYIPSSHLARGRVPPAARLSVRGAWQRCSVILGSGMPAGGGAGPGGAASTWPRLFLAAARRFQQRRRRDAAEPMATPARAARVSSFANRTTEAAAAILRDYPTKPRKSRRFSLDLHCFLSFFLFCVVQNHEELAWRRATRERLHRGQCGAARSARLLSAVRSPISAQH